MSNSIVINNQSVLVKQYNGQRVLTFKDIDIAHGRATGTARKRFNDNKNRFIEGVDYFNVQMSEKRTLGFEVPNRGLTVITESGYLMLAKSFTDDLAWKVQRQLVNSYFKVKELEQPVSDNYTYFDKTYNGELVLTTEDIAHLLKLNRASVSEIVRKNLVINRDYYFLQNDKLMWFKSLNSHISKTIRWIIVVTRKGFDKLCNIYGVEVEKPKSFENKAEDKKQEYPSTNKVITPQIKSSMAEIRREAQRLINLTYLLDDSEGQVLCGETYHQCKAAIIRQMKAIGSCVVVPQKNNF
ncbi:MAG: ORF6N domain-containing protein [Ruminococcus sp.]|nr:ORF6N domain-containing protein [Ruminococcus sp.]